MSFAGVDAVVVSRDGEQVVSLLGAFDPDQGRLYLPYGTDVRGGDTVAVGSVVRSASADAQQWRSPYTGVQAGAVVVLDPAPASLPDLGQLLRNGTSAPVLDETTGVLTIPADSSSWTGPCLAEAANTQGNDPELGGQRVGIVPYLITVPLSLVDVKAGDQFKVTQSRDQRLITAAADDHGGAWLIDGPRP
jgi:hypothetical protein